MKYLLDTDTLIDFLTDHGATRSKLTALIAAGDEVALCAITVAELYSGLTESRRAKYEHWLEALPYWDISREAARQAGIYRKTASDAGRTLAVADSLLAALAWEHDATLLTSNIKDYPMQDVRILSLREEAA